jgi:hypothetical protein
MYEKPQYWTPQGFKRLAKNPFKDGKIVPVLKKSPDSPADAFALTRKPRKKQQFTLTDEAAKQIADVLRGMLQSPGR